MVSRVCRGVIILLFLLLIAPVSIVHAVEYGGLGGVPANPDPDNPRTKSIFVYTLSPGQSKQDGINVVNNTGEVKTIEVYSADSEIASGGSFACRQKVESRNLVGKWITLTQNEVVLSPNSSQVVPFNVVVPNDANVGEHNGCIVIQEKQGGSGQAGNGVQLSFRSALRVAVTIPGDIVKDIQFSELTAKREAKKYTLKAQLKNKGNVSLDTDIKVNVNSLLNKRVYQNGGTYPLLAQKNMVELNFDFSRPFWGGIYRLSGSADYNGDANAPLGSSAAKNVRKKAPMRLLFVPPQPLALALELLLLLLVIVLAWMLCRRLRSRWKAMKKWETYKVRTGDTLVKLAERRGDKWKNIAKINKLRPPYELKKGMVIKLPVKIKPE
jgi:hypothetical protein